jgi:hypothetical protein
MRSTITLCQNARDGNFVLLMEVIQWVTIAGIGRAISLRRRVKRAKNDRLIRADTLTESQLATGLFLRTVHAQSWRREIIDAWRLHLEVSRHQGFRGLGRTILLLGKTRKRRA